MSVQNLLDFFNLATAEELKAADWYWEAHRKCKFEADRLDIPFIRFVYAVAALSPMVRWEDNIRGAVQLAEDGNTGYGFKSNRDKALRCLRGDLEALKGPKVTRFAVAILDPDEFSDVVVVDTWAIRAYEGRWSGEVKTLTPNQYAEIADAYREGADQVGLEPSEFQAVVWTVVRNMGNKKGQIRLV